MNNTFELNLIKSILSTPKPPPYMLGNLPKQGQFVQTDKQTNPFYQIGYCVQIRKGQGANNTDLYLLRHIDGNLVVHENQFLYELNFEQETMLRLIFKFLPEDENYDLGFTCFDKIHKTGYIIE